MWAVTIDMSTTYAYAAREALPHALLAIDGFHVSRGGTTSRRAGWSGVPYWVSSLVRSRTDRPRFGWPGSSTPVISPEWNCSQRVYECAAPGFFVPSVWHQSLSPPGSVAPANPAGDIAGMREPGSPGQRK
ncbi:transposase [Frankia sp. CcWB2]